MKEKQAAPLPRDVSIELMRVIAAFFVIFNHTGMDGYQLYARCLPTQAAFWLYLAVSVFCKLSVPLFFMISGALLLGREPMPPRALWAKKILPMVLLLVLVSAGYYGVDAWKAGGVPDVLEFLEKLYRYHSAIKHHLWFLYFYIAFLIGLPFLQRMAQALEDCWYRYLICLSLIYGLVSMLDYRLGGEEFQMTSGIKPEWLLSNIVIYPCIGYFLQHRFQTTPQRLRWLWALNLCGIALSCGMTAYVCKTTDSTTSELFMGTFSGLNAMCVFASIRYWMQRRLPGACTSRLLCLAGNSAFGIYLLHILFLESPLRGWLMDILTRRAGGLNYMLAAFILCALVMVVCGAITTLLKKLPLLGKLI